MHERAPRSPRENGADDLDDYRARYLRSRGLGGVASGGSWASEVFADPRRAFDGLTDPGHERSKPALIAPAGAKGAALASRYLAQGRTVESMNRMLAAIGSNHYVERYEVRDHVAFMMMPLPRELQGTLRVLPEYL